jgi:hypothetical protein
MKPEDGNTMGGAMSYFSPPLRHIGVSANSVGGVLAREPRSIRFDSFASRVAFCGSSRAKPWLRI